ncbi:MAG: SRPBCC family protein [Armatimonadetes bacterium]|nr:SRPBCC family protein [Armatimonadota bacterium]
MPTASAQVTVTAPLEKVYALAKKIEAFPEFMEDVAEVTIVERSANRQVSRWVGVVREFGRTITWTEEDFWNDEEHSCHFRQIEGDFTEYEGKWLFKAAGNDTVVELEVTYEYRVPLIGPLIQGLLQRKVQQNCQAMLDAIKRQAEQAT